MGTLLLLVGATCALAQEVPTVTVCELARWPTIYYGKMVRIRGEISPPDGENGSAIYEFPCVTGAGRSAPKHAYVLLADPLRHSGVLRPSFDWDETTSWVWFRGWPKFNRETERIIAEVDGIFEAHLPLNSEGGFGHLNGSKFQVIVKSIHDVRIEKR